MEKSLVIVKNENLLVGTADLAKGFGVNHRDIKDLINKYKSEFEEWGVIAFQTQKPTSKNGGRPLDELLLNEEQATYLCTLLRNHDTARDFKRKLTREFFRQRKLLIKLVSQQQNQEWLEKRATGKIERRLETDTIKLFVEYAKEQGSKSAEKYYMVISKMENNSLFALDFMGQKFPNLRDILDGFALDSLKMADHIVGRSLKDGMKDKIHYKDIYKKARDSVESFAILMGKTPLRMIMTEDKRPLLLTT